ncbi:cupredoxin domain-containing protein [Paraburkholderia adhaesiva]|uniref:cupredoxin domain-containing protein n=1 Tax=Paraburkholderia adhaesiva TaxID=2883244 RepID=UPI001F1584A4|nr:cupredoxin family protein [Paraburkholderia adhaesiva]
MQRPSAAVVAASTVVLLMASALSSSAIADDTAHQTEAAQHTARMSSSVHAHGNDEGSSVGRPGDAKNATRTVAVTMLDTMRFDPPTIAVKKGETVHFVIKNVGTVRHEMTLGSRQELKEHADMMRAMPDMAHQDANSVTVEPGRTGDLVWQFTRAGTFDFACLQPGHFEAGMKGTITVK